jgi:hypothetical protein
MKVAALALLIAVAWAAPAAAQFAPYVVTFEAADEIPAGATIQSRGNGVQKTGGHDGRAFLAAGSFFSIDFEEPKATVELYVRTDVETSFRVCGTDDRCPTRIVKPSDWAPLVFSDPGGNATITSISTSGEMDLAIDDLRFSDLPQPQVQIDKATASAPFPGFAEFTFSSSVADATYECAIGQGDFAPCSNPAAFPGLPPGTYTLSVVAVDRYGSRSLQPEQVAFRIDPPYVTPPPPPPPLPPDGDRDGVPDADDSCPDVANSDQADGDGDGVGNACDALPPGNVPPQPGQTSVVKVLSGEVFVKLPARTALGFSGLRAPLQSGGFVPLKGVASIPLDATVDTRRGEVDVASAANSFPAADRRAKRQQARIRAAIFRLKQQRKRKLRSATISTDVSLLTPPGASARCTGAPPKGTVVRTVSMVVKGLYRTLGGASTSTARNASVNTTDRCDGTLTEVGRGRVTVAVKGRKQPVVVRAGQAYLVKAKLFRAKKGRRGGT